MITQHGVKAMKKFTLLQKIISSALKLIVFLSAVIGTYLSWYAGKGSFMGGSNPKSYVNLQSSV